MGQFIVEGLSHDANELLAFIREEYIRGGYPNHKVWIFSSQTQNKIAFAELRAFGFIEAFGTGNIAHRLTDLGQQTILPPPKPPAPSPTIHHHHGESHMGDKYTVTTTNSTIGAQAVGSGAQATGKVTIGHAGALTQGEHLEYIKAARKALVDDEEQLDALLHEVLGQFLRLARDIQVEQKSLAELQLRMKNTLDELWAHHAAGALRPAPLPASLGIVAELARNPVMVEVVRGLTGGAAGI
jgi:hypothetical protein